MKTHVVKFFQFLEAKEGKNAPLKVKLLNSDKYKITKDDLSVKGSLDLSKTDIISLPEGLRVSGYLNLRGCASLTSLPNELYVGEGLTLNGCTSLTSLPNDLHVGEGLYLIGCTSLKTLPIDLRVDKDLMLYGCTSLMSLPSGLKVGRHLYLEDTPIAKMYSEYEIRDMIEATGGYVRRNIYVRRSIFV